MACTPSSSSCPSVEQLEPRRLLSGDTRPDINAVYPEGAFMHVDPTARVIDVTQLSQIAAFNAADGTPAPDATPNDHTDDDSLAFIAALDYVREKLRLTFGPVRPPETSYIIYVPDGVYHVENTIEYSGLPDEDFVQMRIVGQSRDNTIIRLKNGQAGFGAGQRKAIIDFSQRLGDDPIFLGYNNFPGQNALRNLTVHAGRNNPGAVGVEFVGANSSEIHNVSIVSGDGLGEIGLHFKIGMTSGYVRDVSINGFDRGILMHPYHFADPALENITLRDQNEVGIRVVNSKPAIRNLFSDNDVIAVDLTDGGAHVTLLDSTLIGGSPTKPAIRVDDTGLDRVANPVGRNTSEDVPGVEVGHLFARDVRVDGYGSAVKKNGGVQVAGEFIDEYVSDAPIGFDGDQRLRSMNLPVKDVPDTPWPQNMNQWASPDDYNAAGDGVADDTAEVQAAFNNTNARVIYFPSKEYRITSPINVPAHVKRIHLMFTTLSGNGNNSSSYFRVAQNSADPLVVDDVYHANEAFLIDHAKPRTLVLNSLRTTTVYTNSDTSAKRGDLFVNNTNGFGKRESSRAINQNVYARSINTEYKAGPNFLVGDGGTMWVLGYKVESGTISFDVTAGGTLEVLGGTPNQYAKSNFQPGKGSEDIVVTNTDGNVSLVLSSNGPNDFGFSGFDTVIRDTQNGVTRTVQQDDLPDREGRVFEWVLPLYTSYDLDELPLESALLASYDFEGTLRSDVAPPATRGGVSYAPGKDGQGIRFNSGNRLNMPDEIRQEMSSEAGAFSAWVKTSQSSNGMIFYASQNGGDGFGFERELHVHTDGNNIGVFLEGSGKGDVTLSGTDTDGDVTDGQWHHVAATWENGGKIRLYIDGVQRDQKNHNGNVFEFDTHLQLGRPAWGAGGKFTGNLDTLRLFDRALTAAEVADMVSGFPPAAALSAGSGPASMRLAPLAVDRGLFDAFSRSGAADLFAADDEAAD
jgi:hypothetical protein